MNVDELRLVARASVSLDPDELSRTLKRLDDPSAEQLAAEAFEHLSSEDRTVRVAMLRVLAISEGPIAVRGILQGLDDHVKRVREVAAKSSVRFARDAPVARRLEQAVERNERGSAKPAFDILAGLYSAPYSEEGSPMLAGALRSLNESKRHRPAVLTALVRSPLDEEVRDLLREVVRTGTKQEAVIATRRLCGFRVARLEEFPAERQGEIRRTCEQAWGQVWYWVPE
jgi:HEAT repeat protein